MYKIDDEFRPSGRVFMKAQRENHMPVSNVSNSRSIIRNTNNSLVPKGSAITTNLDDRNVKFQHEIMHEKVIEATITDFPMDHYYTEERPQKLLAIESGPANGNVQEYITNKRLSTEVLGSTFETTKTSQRNPDGHRRLTTHIVRKVTTLTRAEEQAESDLIRQRRDVHRTEIGFMTSSGGRAIEPKRSKVFSISLSISISVDSASHTLTTSPPRTYIGLRINLHLTPNFGIIQFCLNNIIIS